MNHSRNLLAVASRTDTFLAERPRPISSIARSIAFHGAVPGRLLNHRQSKPGPHRRMDEASRGFFLSYKADITS
jgi:hypothetical protein